MKGMSFIELRQFYIDHYTLGYFNTNVTNKLVMLGLICYLTNEAKAKKPDVTHYQIIMSLTKDMPLPESIVTSLAIICEDISYGCKEFSTFGVDKKQVISTVKNLLNSYLPF